MMLKVMKVFQLTGKLPSDKGLQVLKDVLSYAHFQFIRSKISFKERKKKFNINLTLPSQREIAAVAAATYTVKYKTI